MKNKLAKACLSWIFTVFLLATGIPMSAFVADAATAQPSVQTVENLIENPGFESGGWELSDGGSIDTSEKYSGNQSAKLVGAAADQYYGSKGIAVDSSKTYHLSAWIKTDGISNADGVSLNVLMVTSNDQPLGFAGDYKPIKTGSTHGWTQYTADISLAPNTAIVRVYVRIDAGVTGTSWFDDVEFEENSNMILNPGFESGGWELSDGGSIDTSEKYSGNQSAKLVGAAADQYYGSKEIAVDPSKTYHLSAWIKTNGISNADGVSLNVLMGTSNDQPLGFAGDYKPIKTGSTHGWTQYTADISLAPNTAIVRVYVRIDAGVTGTSWFDDVEFEENSNMILNSGFESGGWELSDGGNIDTTVMHGGNQSAKLTGTSTDQYYGTKEFTVDPSKSYRLSGWIKTSDISSNGGASLNVLMCTADDHVVGWANNNEKIIKTGGTQGWTYYTFNIENMPSNTACVRVYVRVDANVSGTAWFDDISFEENPSPFAVSLEGPAGNIFTSGQVVSLGLSLQNKSKLGKTVSTQYSAVSYDNQTLKSGTINDTVSANSTDTKQIDLSSITKCGTYTLNVTVSGDKGNIDISKQFHFSIVPKDNSAAQSDSFGVCTHFAHNKGDVNINLPIAAKAGVKWIRDEMYWAQAETVKGQVDVLPKWDEYVNAARADGIQVLLELDFGNSLYDDGNAPYSDEGIAAYANYCYVMANHFKGKINHFEIWNEYNLTGFNPKNQPPETYEKMLAAAYTSIKKANPDAVVIGGSTTGADVDWLKRVFDAGGYQYMDAVSIHPYCYPSSPDSSFISNLTQVHSLIKNYGNDKPVWVTEIGWPTVTGRISELDAGSSLAKTYVLGAVGNLADKIFWYDLQNDSDDESDAESNFGLIRGWLNPDNAFSAKEDFVAYDAAASELNGVKYICSNESDANVRIYKFHRDSDGKDILVLWTLNGADNIGLETQSSQITAVDLLGNTQILTAQNGKLSLTVSTEPVYLEGTFKSADLTAPLFSTDTQTVSASAGDEFTVSIKRDSEIINQSGTFQLALPSGWSLDGNADFTSGSDSTLLTFKIPESAPLGEYHIGIKPVSQNVILGNLDLTVRVVEPVTVQAMPQLVKQGDWSQWTVQFIISNNTSQKTVGGHIDIQSPVELGTGVLYFSSLEPKKTQTVSVKVTDISQYGKLPLKYSVNIDSGCSGFTKSYNRDISFLAAEKATASPKIDGVIGKSEWSDAMPFTISDSHIQNYGGNDDLSAKGFLKWDNSNLYVAVSATDNVHNQEAGYADIWKGDSIQMSIDPDRLNISGISQWSELGFALGNDGNITMWRWQALSGKAQGQLTDAKCKIIRNEDEKTTTYEMAIPWSEILPSGMQAEPDALLGFSMLINDNDGAGRRGWMEYMSGIGDTKDKSLFGDLLLSAQAKHIVSISPVTVSTEVGKTLSLPSTVTAVYSDESTEQLPVIWDEIDPSKYLQVGAFTVDGKVDGSDIPAVATANVFQQKSMEPSISKNPENATTAAGETATFIIMATSFDGGSLSYQWQKSADGITWESIRGATSADYTTDKLSYDDNGVLYRCVVTNSQKSHLLSSVMSEAAKLTVKAASVQPAAVNSSAQSDEQCTAENPKTGDNIPPIEIALLLAILTYATVIWLKRKKLSISRKIH